MFVDHLHLTNMVSEQLRLTFTYHGLDGEHVTRLHDSNCFVFCQMKRLR